MFYGWHLGKAHLEQILKDGIMMAGLGVVTGIKHSNMWKCKQGLWAWTTEAAMPQQRSPKRCLLVMPRKCHGVDKWGMQSLMDSKQKEIPSGSLQRGLQALLIIQQPGRPPLDQTVVVQTVAQDFRTTCRLTQTGDILWSYYGLLSKK